jgi:hypothetical protein
MHGYGLHFLLSPSMRENAGSLAFSRPLRKFNNDIDEERDHLKQCNNMAAIKDKWYYIENLQQRDKFLISFFRRYGELIHKVLKAPEKYANNLDSLVVGNFDKSSRTKKIIDKKVL